MKRRKIFLMLELDADEVFSLPPHLRGLLERPLVDPLQTRQGPVSEAVDEEEETCRGEDPPEK